MNDSTALVAALMEIERFVGRAGWDQPARLFALVGSRELIAAEPGLAEHLSFPGDPVADALSSIEQDGFHAGQDLEEALNRITWPATVTGCALAVERIVLPPRAEADLPDDEAELEQVVAHHPQRQDVRLIAGVLRDGRSHGIARLRDHPDGELVADSGLAPGLVAALARTLD